MQLVYADIPSTCPMALVVYGLTATVLPVHLNQSADPPAIQGSLVVLPSTLPVVGHHSSHAPAPHAQAPATSKLAASTPYAAAAGSCALAPEATPTTAAATAAAARDISAAPAAPSPLAPVAAASSAVQADNTCLDQGPEPGSGNQQPSLVPKVLLTKKVRLACCCKVCRLIPSSFIGAAAAASPTRPVLDHSVEQSSDPCMMLSAYGGMPVVHACLLVLYGSTIYGRLAMP
jgi:hypothetical protein